MVCAAAVAMVWAAAVAMVCAAAVAVADHSWLSQLAGGSCSVRPCRIVALPSSDFDDVVVTLQAGRNGKAMLSQFWDAAKFDKRCTPGKYTKRTPQYLEAFLRHLNTLTAADVFIVGFSRGAAWVIDLAAIALAPYPWTIVSSGCVS